MPSPLYRVYEEGFGFGSGALTAVFGIYAFALLGTLLVVGALSDHVGRRPVLVAALVLEAVAMVLFLTADGVGWLLAARVVQGLATGALTGAFGAALLDLQRPTGPLGPIVNAPPRASGCRSGRVGAGLPCSSCPPDRWVSASSPGSSCRRRRRVGAARVLAAAARSGHVARPRVPVPTPQRRAFLVVLPCLRRALGPRRACTRRWGPSLVASVFGMEDHLVGGLVILALNGTGLVGSLTLRAVAARTDHGGRRADLRGRGWAARSGRCSAGRLALLFVAAVVSGFGFGAAFMGAIATMTGGITTGQRAGLLAGGLRRRLPRASACRRSPPASPSARSG